MANKFSDLSRKNLDQCDTRLVEIAEKALKTMDFTVITGLRTKAEQNVKYARGLSKLKWPESKHNVECESDKSKAFDLAPYPIDWKDTERFYLLAGVVLAVADDLGTRLRWGGDWDSDFDLDDQSFNDLGHFEIVEG